MKVFETLAYGLVGAKLAARKTSAPQEKPGDYLNGLAPPSGELARVIADRDRVVRELVSTGPLANGHAAVSQEVFKDLRGEPDAIKGISDPNSRHLRLQVFAEEEARSRAEYEMRFYGRTGVVDAPDLVKAGSEVTVSQDIGSPPKPKV